MKSITYKFFVFFILTTAYGYSYTSLLALVNQTTRTNEDTIELIHNISPVALAFLTGEFKGLFASYLTLDIGARLGTKVVRIEDGKYKRVDKQINWNNIYKLFTLSQSLDPAFQQTYYVAQGWLPWEPKMITETQKILQTAADARPWDWQPLRFQAFNTYFFLNNPGEAGKILLQAGMMKNAPSFLAILGSRLANKGNETEAAISLLRIILRDKLETDAEYTDINDRLRALEGVLILEKTVKKYRQVHGKNPDHLKDLLDEGLIDSLPKNPYNLVYCINSKGIISFDNPICQ